MHTGTEVQGEIARKSQCPCSRPDNRGAEVCASIYVVGDEVENE